MEPHAHEDMHASLYQTQMNVRHLANLSDDDTVFEELDESPSYKNAEPGDKLSCL